MKDTYMSIPMKKLKLSFRLWAKALMVFVIIGANNPLAMVQAAESPVVVVWDSMQPFADKVDVETRTLWKAIPKDLLALESNPAKSSSDPGYYGRDYAFQGDAILENHRLILAFWSAQGRAVIFSKDLSESSKPTPSQRLNNARKIAELLPSPNKNRLGKINRCTLIRNVGDMAVLEIAFSDGAGEGKESGAVFVLDKSDILEIKPAKTLKAISLLSPIECAIAPSFIGDDLIFLPGEYSSLNTLHIAAQNLLMGLLHNGDGQLIMTWPKGNQQLQLGLGSKADGKRFVESIDFDNDSQSFYLSALSAPGIWHRETLSSSFLEKDVTVQWAPPFNAKWVTQLTEMGIKTTYAFRENKGQIWRGISGMYTYPIWFEGSKTLYRLNKKVAPKGESIVYFIEGKDTPRYVSTPLEILKASLGRSMSDPIIDVEGRKLRTHHRRGAEGVRRACTCGCTEAMQAIFEKNAELDKKEEIAADIEDMIFFVECHLKRIDEYQLFANELIKFAQTTAKANPELKLYLDKLEQIARRIPQECEAQKENMKSLDHAHALAKKTMALTAKKDAGNLKVYMELLALWRDMGGAQDSVVAQCHAIARQLYQEAGYGCVNQPKAISVAQEIFKRCRQCLRNPDGYEIWADY